MANMKVNSDELNLRTGPGTSHPVVAVLQKAQQVDTTGTANGDGWVRASAKIDGSNREGFVKATLLRQPVSDAREALIGAAVSEWFRFEKGMGQEHKSPFYRFVGQMWDAIGMDLDGKDRDVPWSAAFISWIVRQAGETVRGIQICGGSRPLHPSSDQGAAQRNQSAVLGF